ncbi:YcgL domain-containing protein [Solidesulfovibrio alcoholivorans]|uniref:YcgL domain-containing protein n=1 Tax=Solidesulfovibrio alcoholivorans TaxID=81406 RepID=UPI00138E43CB|nr:YcgL domain-containing protein [Solidesulfovibrio alcoholivorans]
MQVDIYDAERTPSSVGKARASLLVPKGTDIRTIPAEVLESLGKLSFRESMNLSEGEKRIALDTNKALKELQTKGWYVSGWEIKITTSVSMPN